MQEDNGKVFPPLDVLPQSFLYQTRPSKSCTIDVDLSRPFYAAGELFASVVTLQVQKALQIQRIRWHLFGAELVHWEVDEGAVKNIYHEVHQLLDEYYTLYDSGKEKQLLSVDIGSKKEWKTHYLLPLDLPPTFSCERACIIYYFRILIEVDGFHNVVQKVIPIPIVQAPELKLEQITTIHGEGVTPSPTISRRFLGGQSSSHLKFQVELFPCLYFTNSTISENPVNPTSISVNLTIESFTSFPIREVTFVITQITKLSLHGNEYIEKDNLVHFVHKFWIPVEPNTK